MIVPLLLCCTYDYIITVVQINIRVYEKLLKCCNVKNR